MQLWMQYIHERKLELRVFNCVERREKKWLSFYRLDITFWIFPDIYNSFGLNCIFQYLTIEENI